MYEYIRTWLELKTDKRAVTALEYGLIAAAGCRRVAIAAPGDLLAVAPSPGRRHLAVVTGTGIVHAHAGLGRVVEGPLDPGWIIVAAWRLPEQE